MPRAVVARLARRLPLKALRVDTDLPALPIHLSWRLDPTTLAQQALSQTQLIGIDVIMSIEAMIDELYKKLSQQVNQILHHAEATELQRAALASGMRPMFRDGIGKAEAGVTSIEEVLRVTREVE